MTDRSTRVLLCATHPRQYNGYSLCAVELAKQLANRTDIELLYYGFQNFYNDENRHRSDFPSNVLVYDAWANENPRGAGFGFDQIKEFVKTHKPDVIILYNDLMVVTTFLRKLHEARQEGMKFKIVSYIDQVYLCQRKDFINIVNQVSDVAMMFTRYWTDVIVPQGIKLPTCYLPHGINDMVNFPIEKSLARRCLSLQQEDFIVLNLNRNQPRKRWDVCIQAFAEVMKTHLQSPIKLLIGTAVQGAWNLVEIYERELTKRGISVEEGMKHLIFHDNPQRVPDEDINILYNVADIGINTCDGEGFGLCQFQHAACGIPQVVPRIGGFLDFFNEDSAIMIEPKMTYYVDTSRDSVCGEAQLSDYRDFAKAIIKYYEDPALRKTHGRNARENILTHYQWEDIGNKLADICITVNKGDLTSVGKIKQPRLKRPAARGLSIPKVERKPDKAVEQVKKPSQPTPEADKPHVPQSKNTEAELDEIRALKQRLDEILSMKT
jgi:glycosyltransferase involved in cell wall biosynthesis